MNLSSFFIFLLVREAIGNTLSPIIIPMKRTEHALRIPEDDLPLNVTILLPFDSTYMPSVMRAGQGIILGFEMAQELELLNRDVRIEFRDSKCSLVYSMVEGIHSLMNKVNVFFGPSCELAVAPVARLLRFWNTPLLTAGAMTSDYNLNKTTNETQYFLTTRTGVSFKDMTGFILDLFQKFGWRKVMLIYEKDGMHEVSGEHTCKFIMSSMVEALRGLSYGTFDLETNNVNASIQENLAKELGTKYSSK